MIFNDFMSLENVWVVWWVYLGIKTFRLVL